MESQGGATKKAMAESGKLVVSVHEEQDINEDTGKIGISRYGEYLFRIVGVVAPEGIVITRTKRWEIQASSESHDTGDTVGVAPSAAPWLIVSNYTVNVGEGEGYALQAQNSSQKHKKMDGFG